MNYWDFVELLSTQLGERKPRELYWSVAAQRLVRAAAGALYQRSSGSCTPADLIRILKSPRALHATLAPHTATIVDSIPGRPTLVHACRVTPDLRTVRVDVDPATALFADACAHIHGRLDELRHFATELLSACEDADITH